MSRRILSIIAVLLAGCTTTTRVSVTPDQLPALAGMDSHGERSVRALGRAERVSVRGDDEIRLWTRSGGRIPTFGEPSWAKVETLRLDRPELSLIPQPHQTAQPDSSEHGQSTPTQAPRAERVAIDEVSSADLKLDRNDPGLTALAVVGIVLASALLAGLVAAGVAFAGFHLTPAPAGGCSFLCGGPI